MHYIEINILRQRVTNSFIVTIIVRIYVYYNYYRISLWRKILIKFCNYSDEEL